MNNCQDENGSEYEKYKSGIGKRLIEVRQASEMKSRKEFRLKFGISQPQLSAIEHGRSFPSMAFICKLTEMSIGNSRINLDWLLTGKGKMLLYEQSEPDDLLYLFENNLSLLTPLQKEVVRKVIDGYLST